MHECNHVYIQSERNYPASSIDGISFEALQPSTSTGEQYARGCE